MHISGLVLLLLLIVFAFLISERTGKKGGTVALVARKCLHIAGVGGLAVSPLVITNYYLLTAITIGFCMILFLGVKKKVFAADIYNRRSWGIALFPFSFLLLWLLYGKDKPELVVLPMMVLTFSDAAADLTGVFLGKKHYNLTGDSKTFAGSVAFLIVTVFCLYLLPSFSFFSALPGWSNPFSLLGTAERWVLILTIALVVTLVEGLTSGGWDNVSVPLFASWLLAVWPLKSEIFILTLFPALLLFSLFGLLSFQKGWLSACGAVTAGLLGLVIYTGGGWKALLVIGVFFLSGSLWGSIHAKATSGDSKLGKPRDYMQVICNGGIAGICMVWAGMESLSEGVPFTLFAISVAISTADTWSSELGIFFKGRVVDILGFRPMPSGVSGGVSWQGTLAGLLGAACIALMATPMGVGPARIVFAAGFSGMLLDSVLGSLFQAKYIVDGKWSDVPAGLSAAGIRKVGNPYPENPEKTEVFEPVRGKWWSSNDWVNLFSNFATTLAAGISLLFLWKGG